MNLHTPRQRIFAGMLHLPLVLLPKIALCIADARTFFDFLQAMGTADVRGPLEALWQLGLDFNRTDLWPKLVLTEEIMRRAESRGWVEAIMLFYATVAVACTDDLAWLRRHLTPQTMVEWATDIPSWTEHFYDEPHLAAWITQWAGLPLVTISDHQHRNLSEFSDFFPAYVYPEIAQYVRAVLPHCQHLMHVQLAGYTHASSIFELAATSTNLVVLKVSFATYFEPFHQHTRVIVAPEDADGMLSWLQATAVEAFYLDCWEFATTVPDAVQDAVYNAMMTCPTLRQLALSNCNLHGRLVLPMQSLSSSMLELKLHSCRLAPSDLHALAAALPQSSLHRLHLCNIDYDDRTWTDAYVCAFECLVSAVVHSSVTILALEKCQRHWRKSQWYRLVPCLRDARLVSLSLAHNYMSNQDYADIVHLVHSHATLRHLNVAFTKMKIELHWVAALLADATTVHVAQAIQVDVADRNRCYSCPPPTAIAIARWEATLLSCTARQRVRLETLDVRCTMPSRLDKSMTQLRTLAHRCGTQLMI
ncbi:Aste57867_21554 [Aphanomyces stellatus]|uniref:Aste57867_21554 protein n=1 Tax=Aphanomyces stellatus TaxID=120398 RepID=A0A485LHT1_9STRA|nr:hypothetical protein As57867_021485 [Aphanomyces stellatus]VFT98224.1 Aste57867_21554 [Aphanomyces stellatus]